MMPFPVLSLRSCYLRLPPSSVRWYATITTPSTSSTSVDYSTPSSSRLRLLPVVGKGGSLERVDLKPIIRTPVPMQRKALKRKSKVLFGRMDRFEGERHRPVIQCRRPELDHFFRQTYSKVDRVPLASEHWQSRKTHGDYFTFTAWNGSGHRPNGSAKTFGAGLGLDPRLVSALRSCGFRRPTLIQQLAIPNLVSGESCLVASETGNGKTLAFLAPLVHLALTLKETEEVQHLLRPPNSPFAMVVTPGVELAKQIFNVAQVRLTLQ